MGFLKLVNEHTLDWLLKKYPNAFLLLTLIAKRAKRVDDDKTGLKKCQAYIGDYKECGLTEQKYRTAKRVLEINELITTQATNKGTIATLLNTRVYDINAEDDNEQKNTTQRSNNEQITTNKKLRSKECKEEKKTDIVPLVMEYLNQVTKSKFINPQDLTARIKEGYTLDDFKLVIDKKSKDPYFIEHPDFMCPKTLFCKRNFDGYLNAPAKGNGNGNQKGAYNGQERLNFSDGNPFPGDDY